MYKILRFETCKNREGLDEIFLYLNIEDNDIGNYEYVEWINIENSKKIINNEITKDEYISLILEKSKNYEISKREEDRSNNV